MNTLSDIALLDRWHEQHDPIAFKELTLRYGGLVFSAANRVLRNPADAEEIAQECFLKLAKHPTQPRESLAAWLHTVAVHLAIDRIRAESRRRDREATYGDSMTEEERAELNDVLHHVDAAISTLPPKYRDCIVGHFLRDLPQEDLASNLGISRWTVRRRMNEGVRRVRQVLLARGITTSVGGLTLVLASTKSEALSPALVSNLGKIAVGGITNPVTLAARAVAGNTIQRIGGYLFMKKAMGILTATALTLLATWWIMGSDPGDLENASTAVIPEEEVEVEKEPKAQFGGGFVATKAPPPGADAPAAAEEASPPTGQNKRTWRLLSDRDKYPPTPIQDPTKYASITGVVLDDRGRAIPDAEVTVMLNGADIPTMHEIADRGPDAWAMHTALVGTVLSDPANQYTTTTDPQGAYQIDRIAASGMATVAARAPGFEVQRKGSAVYPEETVDVSFSLPASRALYGRIVTPAGEPVAHATVESLGQISKRGVRGGLNLPEPLRVRTDKSGDFTLWLADHENGSETFTGIHVFAKDHGEALFSPIEIGLEERQTFTLNPQAGNLSGHIYTQDKSPAAGHQVFLTGTINFSMESSGALGSSLGAYYEATVERDGRYTIQDLPTFAEYTATIYSPNGVVLARNPLPTLKSGTDNTWDYTIAPAIVVTGDVRAEGSHQLLSNIVVRYSSKDAGGDNGRVSGLTRTDTQGAFSFQIVTGPGSYTFVPSHQRDGIWRDTSDVEETVELQPGDDTFVALTIAAPWSRGLQLVDQFGQPVADVAATMKLHYDRNTWGTVRPEQTDDMGMIQFDNLDPEAEASFQFSKQGYVPARSARIGVEFGEALPTEPFTLYQTADCIARLVDEAGNPLANVALSCLAHYGDERQTTVDGATNEEGWLVLSGALPGTTLQLRISTDTPDAAQGPMEGVIKDTVLEVGMENNLGDIVLTATRPEAQ